MMCIELTTTHGNTSLGITNDTFVETIATFFEQQQNDSHSEHSWNIYVPSYLYREVPMVFKLAGAVLNIISFAYFIRSKKYKSPIFMIFSSLAFVDFCVCFGGAGYSAFLFPIMRLPGLPYLCQIFSVIAPFGEMGSAYHLVFLAALTLYQVARPLHARAVVTTSLMVKICLSIIIVIGSCQLAYGLNCYTTPAVIREENVAVCVFSGDSKKKDLAFMIFGTAIPCPTLFLLHATKYCVFKWSSKLVNVQQARKNPNTPVVVLVITLFYITRIPAFAYMVVHHFEIEGYENTDDNLCLVLLYVMHSNSIMHPIIYVLALKSIRDDFLSLCRKHHTK